MKDTLKFYNNIYEPLFKVNYTRSLNRGKIALKIFNNYIKKHNIKIKNMIDVGCAWGKTLDYWAKKKVKCCGVDVSNSIVGYCKKRKFKCYLASATDLSIFPDKKFDLYMATDVYEHLREDDLKDAIEEAKRITKKYFLIRPHPVLDKRKILHLTVWSLNKWEDFFKKNNLKIIKIGENNESSYKNVFFMIL
jgi:hypothetical protein